MMEPYQLPHQKAIDWWLGWFVYILWGPARRALAEYVVNSYPETSDWECKTFQVSGKGTIVVFVCKEVRYSTMLDGEWRKTT